LRGLKRFFTIAFTLIYLITSSGILVGQHLCMGRVKEASLFKKVDMDCGMNMPMPMDMDDCCDDEWALKVIEDEQQAGLETLAPKASYFMLYEVLQTVLTLNELDHSEDTFIVDNGPPDNSAPPLYLYYHKLKIPADLLS